MTIIILTLNVTIAGTMTPSIMTFGIMAFSIMTFSYMTLNIIGVIIQYYDTQHKNTSLCFLYLALSITTLSIKGSIAQNR